MNPEPDLTYTPPAGPPNNLPVSREIHAAMGDENIYRMCRDFYAELEQSEIRPMFPEDMALASTRLAAFLVGLFGGPPQYQQRYGPPMMRKRHLHVAIDERARKTWVACFMKVLRGAELRYGFPAEHMPGFMAFIEGFSCWMVNRPPE